jgi:hypothetical protein
VAHFGGVAVFAPLLSAAADFRDRVTLLELFHIFELTARDDGKSWERVEKTGGII